MKTVRKDIHLSTRKQFVKMDIFKGWIVPQKEITECTFHDSLKTRQKNIHQEISFNMQVILKCLHE